MTQKEIFDAYLEDQCPVCKSKKIIETGNALIGGKTMAVYLFCRDCFSKYTIGIRMPFESEITLNTQKK